MRVFTTSDLHLDYAVNLDWLLSLSTSDFQEDILILAGDISDKIELLSQCFDHCTRCFRQVLYVPGNHDLWVHRDKKGHSSFEKFARICELAEEYDVSMSPLEFDALTIVPLLSWYDYSFGLPSENLLNIWRDFTACDWGLGYTPADVNRFFLDQNLPHLELKNKTLISFSHFLPRIDVMPFYIPQEHRKIYPVLGSSLLDQQVRKLSSDIHIYGHSHVNRDVSIKGIRYINNAFAYPSEQRISAKKLRCVYQD